ncbi:MAG: thymidine phosphorylase family protein [Sphingomonadales bacterium]|nr:thymidine phosphorylase family protein [Sphingomonadales bacterium]
MLKLACFHIDTYGENVAFLSRYCTQYRAEDFQALNKIEVTSNGKTILATLNIVEDAKLLDKGTLGLSVPAFRRMGLDEGVNVSITQAAQPRSIDHVRTKINGEALPEEAYRAIIRDIAAYRYSKMEIAAFLISCASFMTTKEVLALTRAMADVGTQLRWDHPMVVDKHCVGGIPGNRTSMIVVPIVAAYGLPIPKTSSRAITSPAGTADTMEVLANVDVAVDKMQDMVSQLNGCLAWGGRVNLSPADDIMISVERPLAIDTAEQMVASILSKKLAAGSTHLLVDMPVGPTAKVRTQAEAVRLRKLFEFVGREVGLHVDVVVTDGSQPIGRGIGPALEARDVMQVLENDPNAPDDLRERALMLAGRIIDMDPVMEGGCGLDKAREILKSGRALALMDQIIDAQGRVEEKHVMGPLTRDILASEAGVVKSIDCFRMARIARLAGAPIDKGAGIDLFNKVGDRVKQGEVLYRIHAHVQADFGFASKMADEDCGFIIDGND